MSVTPITSVSLYLACAVELVVVEGAVEDDVVGWEEVVVAPPVACEVDVV